MARDHLSNDFPILEQDLIRPSNPEAFHTFALKNLDFS